MSNWVIRPIHKDIQSEDRNFPLSPLLYYLRLVSCNLHNNWRMLKLNLLVVSFDEVFLWRRRLDNHLIQIILKPMNRGEYDEQLSHSSVPKDILNKDMNSSLSPLLYCLRIMTHNLNHDWQALIHLCYAWIVVHYVCNVKVLYWLEVLNSWSWILRSWGPEVQYNLNIRDLLYQVIEGLFITWMGLGNWA